MRNILLLLVLLVLGTWWMRHNERKRDADRMRPPPASGAKTTVQQSLPPAERMVRCQECDTYLPESDAIHGAGGTHFCSGAHRDAYLARERRA
ncbi:PP0621 family protein [Pandoraea sp. PE-S2R-1]|uniref:PP0621 family protein n=1 Tax=Pandoraea sp. PE-S2R-1 TaxID=1986994 RepID=UPI000B3F8A2A|nr:PP0621 family protein [Pandoraea sp. PE-S2R-1]